MMGWINGNGVSGAVSTPRASEPTILGAKVLPYLQLRAFPSCCPGACDCRAASCVNSVYANECVCIRVCEYECKGMCVNGFQLESKNPQCCMCLHLYRLTMAAADARGRCASVSSPTGHLGVNRWKPGQPIQKNCLSDSFTEVCAFPG